MQPVGYFCLLRVLRELLTFFYIFSQLKSESLKTNMRANTSMAMKLCEFKWKVSFEKRCAIVQ